MTTNVIDHLQVSMSLSTFKQSLLAYWLNKDIKSNTLKLTQEDLDIIEQMKRQKYMSWAWNFGESPAFEINKHTDEDSVRIKVTAGLIEEFLYKYADQSIRIHTFSGIKFDQASYKQTLNQLEDNTKTALEKFTALLFD